MESSTLDMNFVQQLCLNTIYHYNRDTIVIVCQAPVRSGSLMHAYG